MDGASMYKSYPKVHYALLTCGLHFQFDLYTIYLQLVNIVCRYKTFNLAFNEKTCQFICMTGFFAPQVGLEPTTYGLTVRRSNQLSY